MLIAGAVRQGVSLPTVSEGLAGNSLVELIARSVKGLGGALPLVSLVLHFLVLLLCLLAKLLRSSGGGSSTMPTLASAWPWAEALTVQAFAGPRRQETRSPCEA